jgi:branched-chain amino acid transport system permease protein
MVLLGGFAIFEGPLVGAMLFNYLRLYAVAATEYWMLIIGSTLILLVLALPSGVTGGLARLGAWLAPRRSQGS